MIVLAEDPGVPEWGQNVRAWLPLNALPSEIAAAVFAAANELTVLTAAQAGRWLPGQESIENRVREELLGCPVRIDYIDPSSF